MKRASSCVVLQEIDVPDAGRVLSGSADLIVDFEASVPHGLASRRVGTHFAFVVCPASYASARHKPPTFAELAQRPFVSYHPRLPHFEHQMRALDRLGRRPETMLSAASTEAILGFVQAELGYSLIPWPKPTGPRVRGVLALRQSGPGTEFRILAMYKERAEQDPLVAAALAVLD